MEVPYFVSWEVWKHINKAMFKYVEISIWRVFSRVISGFKEYHLDKFDNRVRALVPHPSSNFEVVSYFDGAS